MQADDRNREPLLRRLAAWPCRRCSTRRLSTGRRRGALPLALARRLRDVIERGAPPAPIDVGV
ncbi:MAG: hypothetical protein ACJ74I_16330 [Gaiellaceae bacterium]